MLYTRMLSFLSFFICNVCFYCKGTFSAVVPPRTLQSLIMATHLINHRTSNEHGAACGANMDASYKQALKSPDTRGVPISKIFQLLSSCLRSFFPGTWLPILLDRRDMHSGKNETVKRPSLISTKIWRSEGAFRGAPGKCSAESRTTWFVCY